MKRYWVFSVSWPAPFFADADSGWQYGESPSDALKRFRKEYKHPSGLQMAEVFEDANAYHDEAKPLARYKARKRPSR